MDEGIREQIMEQFALLHRRFDGLEQRMDRLEQRMDRLEQQRAEDRAALMETLRIVDERLDRLEQQTDAILSGHNDLTVRHRHLVHKVAELEEAVAAASAK